MIKITTIFAAGLIALGLAAPVDGAGARGDRRSRSSSWSFAGIFGTYDQNQLQRGFQVFQEVCASCHRRTAAGVPQPRGRGRAGLLGRAGQGAGGRVRRSPIPTAEGGKRKGVAADRWPAPFATEQDARDANGGALPPDLSVLAKARGVDRRVPVLDLQLLHRLFGRRAGLYPRAAQRLSRTTPPARRSSCPRASTTTTYFPGHAIGMPPPLTRRAGAPMPTATTARPVPLTRRPVFARTSRRS